MSTLRAFHGDPAVKQKYLDRVAAHAAADRLVQGTGWDHGRGCAIGCTLEAYDHARYPVELGLPVWLAHLEDRIFEGLPKSDAMTWPQRFLAAIPVGADVETVRHKLAIRRLGRMIAAQQQAEALAYVKAAIAQVLGALALVRSCHEAELGGSTCDWSAARSAARSARSAARSAAWSARSAARSAAESAESAAGSAEWSAESAAVSAAGSAEWSARSAADSAEWSAEWSARSAARSARSARSAEWQQEAADLLELLAEAAHD